MGNRALKTELDPFNKAKCSLTNFVFTYLLQTKGSSFSRSEKGGGSFYYYGKGHFSHFQKIPLLMLVPICLPANRPQPGFSLSGLIVCGPFCPFITNRRKWMTHRTKWSQCQYSTFTEGIYVNSYPRSIFLYRCRIMTICSFFFFYPFFAFNVILFFLWD